MRASTAIGILMAIIAVVTILGLVNMFVPMDPPPVYTPDPGSTASR